MNHTKMRGYRNTIVVLPESHPCVQDVRKVLVRMGYLNLVDHVRLTSMDAYGYSEPEGWYESPVVVRIATELVTGGTL